jgi:tripartite-type tricarboxylate transporter receptor subunit TctC
LGVRSIEEAQRRETTLDTPPGVPADRAKVLQDAFAATMKDPEFLTEATAQKFEIEATSGPDMAAYIDRLYTTPAPLLKRATDMIAQMQK